jgi:hypothetical protein
VSSDFVLPLHALYQIIKSEKLTPRPPQKIDQKKYEELDSHRTFMGTITRFLSHQSYASIAQGLKHYPEFLKEKMKSDSHILASEFAL